MQEYRAVRDVRFGKEEVPADGCEFIDCRFDGTTLVFNGLSPFIVTRGTGRPKVKFTEHAGTTLTQLAAMYHFGLAGVVEGLFDQVRDPA